MPVSSFARTFISLQFYFERALLPKLNDCETDDDVAMCFLKNKEGFEKYLQYLVGQGQAESAVSDKVVHRFFKVTQLCLCVQIYCFASCRFFGNFYYSLLL